jgi:Holliday junction resolvasome RuvABC DNA-binding subunit
LKSIPRIGAKIADRVVLELQKKIGQEMPEFGHETTDGKGHEVREAIDALSSLGFTRVQAEKAIETALKRGAKSVEELVKQSLRME